MVYVFRLDPPRPDGVVASGWRPRGSGYRDYQDPGYKEYGSDRSLSQTVDFEKVVLPNLELYERTGQYENREDGTDGSGQSVSLPFRFADVCATAGMGKSNR